LEVVCCQQSDFEFSFSSWGGGTAKLHPLLNIFALFSEVPRNRRRTGEGKKAEESVPLNKLPNGCSDQLLPSVD